MSLSAADRVAPDKAGFRTGFPSAILTAGHLAERAILNNRFSSTPPKALEDQGPDFFKSESFKRLSHHLPTVEEMRESRQKINEERRPEIAILSVLKRMAGELEALRKQPERFAAKVQECDEELARYQTGAPGRPGSSHLVKDEFERRLNLGRVETSLAEQARVLVEWLTEKHPSAHPVKPRTVENSIRHLYRNAQSKSKKS